MSGRWSALAALVARRLDTRSPLVHMALALALGVTAAVTLALTRPPPGPWTLPLQSTSWPWRDSSAESVCEIHRR